MGSISIYGLNLVFDNQVEYFPINSGLINIFMNPIKFMGLSVFG